MKFTKRQMTIFIALVGIYAGLSGILNNTIGVFFAAILKDTGFRAGDLSVYYMIRSLVTAGVVGFTTKWYLKGNSKMALLIMELLFIVSFGAMAFFHDLWQWYIAAVAAGIGGSCFIVIVSVTLNNWFIKNRGLILGITMSSSGVAGAVLSPIFSKMIGSMGWRTTVLITTLICVIVIVVPTVLWFVPKPEMVSELPYGYEELPMTSETKQTEAIHKDVPKTVFFMAVFAILLPATMSFFTSQMPTFAQSIGYTLEVGAMLTSTCMIGNVCGKLVMGWALDKFGVYKAAQLFVVTLLISVTLFLLFQSTPMILYGASVLFGCVYALVVNTQPILLLDLYGPDDYQMKMSRVQQVVGLVGAGISVAIPYLYDFTGSYNIFFYYGIVGMVISFILFSRLQAYSKKEKTI